MAMFNEYSAVSFGKPLKISLVHLGAES